MKSQTAASKITPSVVQPNTSTEWTTDLPRVGHARLVVALEPLPGGLRPGVRPAESVFAVHLLFNSLPHQPASALELPVLISPAAGLAAFHAEVDDPLGFVRTPVLAVEPEARTKEFLAFDHEWFWAG